MKIRNCSPAGSPLILDGHGEIQPGQTVEVTDELGAALVASSSSWEVADAEVRAASHGARKGAVAKTSTEVQE